MKRVARKRKSHIIERGREKQRIIEFLRGYETVLLPDEWALVKSFGNQLDKSEALYISRNQNICLHSLNRRMCCSPTENKTPLVAALPPAA